MSYKQDMKKVKNRMFELNITQEELAKRMSISVSTAGRKLNGITEFTISEAQMLCNLLGLNAEDIFFIANVPYTQRNA